MKKFSRYGDPRHITNNGNGYYTIEGKAHYYRVGMNDDNTEIAYFDPEGGDMIMIGSVLENRRVTSIVVEKAPKDHFKILVETEELDSAEADANSKEFRRGFR